jgi:hypothetical protein
MPVRYARALLVLSLIVSMALPTAAAEPLPFPDGTWHGTGMFNGAISDERSHGQGSGSVVFDIALKNGKVIAGRLKMQGSMKGIDDGVRVEGTAKATYDLSGKANRILASGKFRGKGTGTYEGLTLPAEFVFHVEGETLLRPELVTCNRIEGEFTSEHEAELAKHGISSEYASSFVAVRSDGSAKVEKILKDYQHVLDEAFELYRQVKKATDAQTRADLMVKANTLIGLLEQSVNAEIATLGPCDVPSGLEGGVETLITQASAAFIEAMVGATDPPPDVPTLLELLALALQSGAAQSGATSQSGSPSDAGLKEEIESAIGGGLAAADPQTKLDVFVQAQMYGLDDLFAKAKAAMGS